METKKTPPAYGLSGGPMIVACQWNMSSATGPALQLEGGSFCKSLSSFKILFEAMAQTRKKPREKRSESEEDDAVQREKTNEILALSLLTFSL